MKRRLELLIRIQKQYLDEARKHMIQLETQMNHQIEQLKALNAEVLEEKNFTSHHLKYSYTWRGYLKTAQLREKDILHFIEQLNRNIIWEKKNIQQLFEELKSYEVARDQLAARQTEEEKLAEQKDLDEIAIIRHLRKR